MSACAAVDQFGSRIYDGNLNSQNAQNQEILLNVIRASNYQPLNFVAITSVTGGQTESLNTGLPTLTFGPMQTVAQHLFQVSNSVNSSVTGGYQSSPLVSTAFQSGMLSPIDVKTLALLIAVYPREPVFYSTIESITFRRIDTGEMIRMVNDPVRDFTPDCPDRVRSAKPSQVLGLKDECSFSVFTNSLGLLLNAGFTAELNDAASDKKDNAKAPAKKAADKSAQKNAKTQSADASSASVSGRLCFDRTRSLLGTFRPGCGATNSGSTAVRYFLEGVGEVEINLALRSPIGLFNYFGAFLSRPPMPWTAYYSTQARNLLQDGEPFLNVVTTTTEPCFSQVFYGSQTFCVPVSSRHTSLLFTMLIHLRNLNIQPSDLNSAFSVRLVN